MRNIAVEYAKANDYDYVFQVDTDMIYPKETIVELIKHKKQIIGGLYFKRQKPHTPVHWKKLSMGGLHNASNLEYCRNGKVKQVEASGGGGVLMKVKAFKKLKAPYFQVRYRKNGQQCVGEDIDFCFKIKNKIKFFIDPKIKYAHLTQMAITGEKEMKEIL
jgi:GT2 family glycosyltransferase